MNAVSVEGLFPLERNLNRTASFKLKEINWILDVFLAMLHSISMIWQLFKQQELVPKWSDCIKKVCSKQIEYSWLSIKFEVGSWFEWSPRLLSLSQWKLRLKDSCLSVASIYEKKSRGNMWGNRMQSFSPPPPSPNRTYFLPLSVFLFPWPSPLLSFLTSYQELL